MGRRIFNIAAVVSAATFVLLVVMATAGKRADPRTQHVSLANRFHVGIWDFGVFPRVVFFNDADYGPYSGSIIGMVGGKSGPASRPQWPHVTAVGDRAGVYYRHIRQEDGSSLWTLAISLAYPLLVTLVLPVAWIIRRSRRGTLQVASAEP